MYPQNAAKFQLTLNVIDKFNLRLLSFRVKYGNGTGKYSGKQKSLIYWQMLISAVTTNC